MKQTTIFLFFLALSFSLLAQPTTISWQGKLLDASGIAITQNNVAMTFAMFDALTGGNQLWPASGVVTKTVDVVQGLYSVQLGTGTGDDIAFTAAMFNGLTPWLEVKIGTETLPRTEITNVPFALISNDLSATGWENPGEIGKTTPNSGKFTSVETGNLKVTDGASDGKVLTSDADGNASWTTPYTGLTNFTESNFTYNSKTGVKFLATNAATDVDLVLQPKGAGSFIVRQPDGTSSGGNTRGLMAVDLQLYANQSDMVASGNGSVISGGTLNKASGEISTVTGGYWNSASGFSSSISGGYKNISSGEYSSVSGGYQNTASGNSSIVSGGNNNTASKNYSTVSGGYYNSATGISSFIPGGEHNTSSGNGSSVLGGIYNTSGGDLSLSGGYLNTAQSFSEIVFGSCATIGTGNPSSFTSTDRLFVVGNGTSDGARSNALTILKNANTTIGGSLTLNGNGTNTSITFPTSRGTNGQVLQTDGSGNTSWSSFTGSQWTTSGSDIYYSAGKVGIGTSSPQALLDLGNAISNRKILLYSSADNDHQFTGFGLNADALRFQLATASGNFKFCGATSSTASTELFRIQGNGQIIIPALSTAGVLLNSSTGLVSSSVGSNGQILTTNGSGGITWTTPSGGTVTGVNGTAPIVSSGGSAPTISINAATTSVAGSMSAADKTKLDAISGTNTGDQTITLTGDVTGFGTGSFATAISSASVTNAKMANMAANTMKVNNTEASASPSDLSITANTFPARSSTGNIAAKPVTDFALSILDDANASAVRTTIGAGTGNGTVTTVSGTAPINVATGTTTPVISIAEATTSAAGSMSAADKTKLDGLTSSQWTTSGSNIYYNTGNVGIGTATTNAQLQLGNATANRKIILWQNTNDDHQFYGLGVNSHTLRYQVPGTTDSHVFYAGTTTPTSTELFKIQGNGQVVIPAMTTPGLVQNDATGTLSSTTGTAPGQMLYWNGSAWVSVAAGQNGQILKFVNGVPTWVNDDFINSLQIGDYFQGGIIAYFLQPGDPGYDAQVRHGIIAAPSDQGPYPWGCNGTTISGADGTVIGTGNQNTLDIVAGCSSTGIAARICNDLVLNGYSDWYLPSKDELNKLYLNKTSIGGFASADYWCSSEHDSNWARAQFFSDGSWNVYGKNYALYVRAVRDF